MKKILSTLAIVGIATPISTTVVSCNSNKDNSKDIPKDSRINLDKFTIKNLYVNKAMNNNAVALSEILGGISDYAKFKDSDKLLEDTSLTIMVTLSNGEKFSNKIKDKAALSDKAVAGKTEINISVAKNDKLLTLTKPLNLEVNLTITN